MTTFISRLRGNTWRHWLIALCFPFIATLIPALVVKLIFHKSVGEIAGVYLAFVTPQVLCMLAFGFLNKWVDRGAQPNRAAIAVTICISIYGTVMLGLTLYLGFVLHVLEADDIVVIFILAEVGIGVGAFFNYPKALANARIRSGQKQISSA